MFCRLHLILKRVNTLKKRFIIVGLVLGIFFAFLFMGSKNEAMVVVKDQVALKYGDISEKQELDIYYPKEVKSSGNPAIIYLHGGSYISGTKDGSLNINKKLFNDNGFIYIPVDYRLSTEEVFPGALDDVKTAIRYIKENSTENKVDVDNIFIIGHSAGANLGSMVATTRGIEAFGNEKIEHEEYSSDIAGFVGIAGFYDINGFFEYMSTYGRKDVYQNIIKYYGKDSYDKFKPFILENNSNYLKNMKTPVYVQHGLKDTVVPASETKKYCSSLKFANKDTKLRCEYIANNEHSFSDFVTGSNSNKIVEWIKEQVNNK